MPLGLKFGAVYGKMFFVWDKISQVIIKGSIFTMNIRRFIGDRAFYKMALTVAVPIMIQNGITNFVSLLDNIMVGRVGTVQMSGVAVANTILFVLTLAFFGAVSGAGIFGAQFYGKKDFDGCRHVLRYKLLVAAALTVIGCGIFIIFGEDLIMLYLRGDGDVKDIEATLKYGRSYLLIMLAGIPAFAVSQCYSSSLRESGETVVPMVAGICAVFVNLGLNAVLIFGYLGAPALGSDGAAAATVISRYVEAAIVVIWTHRNHIKVPFIKGLFKGFYIPASLIRAISLKGLPLLLNETFWSVGFALLNQCYSLRGHYVLGAVNISSTIINVCNVTFLAMGTSIGIIIGQLLGAGRIEEALDRDRKLITFSVFIATLTVGVLVLFSGIFPGIYDTEQEVRELAQRLIIISAVLLPMRAYSNAVYFTLRSGGKIFITILFDSVFTCVILSPVAFILGNFTSLPIEMLYFICNSMEGIKCILGYFMLKSGIWLNNIVDDTKTRKEIKT